MNKAPSGRLVIPGYIDKSRTNTDINEKLDKILDAVEQIYLENASSLSFQLLYTTAYQIVVSKQGEILYNKIKDAFSKYVQDLREKIVESKDEIFLKDLLQVWNKHRTSVNLIRDILMYMDKNYVPQSKKMPLFELGIKLFGQEVFQRDSLERIQRLIMEMIRKERDGEEVADKFLLKELMGMMIEISKKDIYQAHFERVFLLESRQYFENEARRVFESTTAVDYLKKVEARLNEERERAKRCLDVDTVAKIENEVKTTMIEKYKESIIEKEGTGCMVMLQEWRVEDLRLVFDVLSMVPNALDPCVELVNNYCRSQGLQIVKDQQLDEKPLEMVEKCIRLKENYDDLLERAFSTKKGNEIIHSLLFSKAIKMAFNEIINANEKFPEYLSLYIDSKLRIGKSQIAESEFEVLFDQVIGLFRHLREKDIFETYYKNHLAKRLLSQRSQSDEAEKSFISKLKTEVGYQFTAKLEGMFSDMRVSRESMEAYKKYCEENKSNSPIDMNIQVLTTGSWPVHQAFAIRIPEQMELACEHFKTFYTQMHSGRKLTWQYTMGNANVKFNGFELPYELNVTTLQACILLLFNDRGNLTYAEIAAQTSIPNKDLKLNILALTLKNNTHDKVLIKNCDKTLETESKFTVNTEFKSKSIKVKISPVVLKENKEQAQNTLAKVNEERKFELDAAIVRIMKARKTLEHRDLVLEVTKQLQHRFMPAPDFIKKRIEDLIDREYLTRSQESTSKYVYLA